MNVDSVKDQPGGAPQIVTEFINSLVIVDLPFHDLKLQNKTIIVMFRYLDVS